MLSKGDKDFLIALYTKERLEGFCSSFYPKNKKDVILCEKLTKAGWLRQFTDTGSYRTDLEYSGWLWDELRQRVQEMKIEIQVLEHCLVKR